MILAAGAAPTVCSTLNHRAGSCLSHCSFVVAEIIEPYLEQAEQNAEREGRRKGEDPPARVPKLGHELTERLHGPR